MSDYFMRERLTAIYKTSDCLSEIFVISLTNILKSNIIIIFSLYM